MTRLLATRFPAKPLPCVQTENKYDYDYNIIDTNEPGPFITRTYYGDTCSIPAELFERLFWLMSSNCHQALLMWHQQIQGTQD